MGPLTVLGKLVQPQRAETSREVLSPRNATLADILLPSVVRDAHRDRHELIRTPQINAYRHQTLAATGPAFRTKFDVCSPHACRRDLHVARKECDR